MGGTVALRSPMPTFNDRRATDLQLLMWAMWPMGLLYFSAKVQLLVTYTMYKVSIRLSAITFLASTFKNDIYHADTKYTRSTPDRNPESYIQLRDCEINIQLQGCLHILQKAEVCITFRNPLWCSIVYHKIHCGISLILAITVVES